jgi:hypothetical protein
MTQDRRKPGAPKGQRKTTAETYTEIRAEFARLDRAGFKVRWIIARLATMFKREKSTIEDIVYRKGYETIAKKDGQNDR